MSRTVGIAAAQLGPIHLADTRVQVVERLIVLLEEAHAVGCRLVVFPELALTTFFPRWWTEDQSEVDAYFETEMPGPETQPLFDRAKELGMGFYLGYAELTEEEGVTKRYNTSILVASDGRQIGKYRKIHLPGHRERLPTASFQHLEKKYFDVGDLGFPAWRAFGGVVGMCICNDRRWPETFRVLGFRSGTGDARLQYPHRKYSPSRTRAPTHVPQSHHDAGERLPERHLGRRCGQVRRRGRILHDRRFVYRGADR